MIAYHATKGGIHLRVLAYKPALEPVPDGCLRVVIQVVEQGRPIAEDPIHTETLPILELARVMHISRNDGWEFAPWKDAA